MGRHWDQRSPRSRGRREGRRRRRWRRGPRGWEPVHRWRSGRSGGAGRGAGHTGTGRLREGVKRQLGQTMYSEGRYGGWVELNKRSDQMSEWFSFSETPVIKPDYLMTSLTVSPLPHVLWAHLSDLLHPSHCCSLISCKRQFGCCCCYVVYFCCTTLIKRLKLLFKF